MNTNIYAFLRDGPEDKPNGFHIVILLGQAEMSGFFNVQLANGSILRVDEQQLRLFWKHEMLAPIKVGEASRVKLEEKVRREESIKVNELPCGTTIPIS